MNQLIIVYNCECGASMKVGDQPSPKKADWMARRKGWVLGNGVGLDKATHCPKCKANVNRRGSRPMKTEERGGW